MDRGELVTAYADVPAGTTGESLLATLREFYKNEPFVRIVDHLPGTKDVSHTNFCDVTARVVGGKAVIVSVIDNLIKGASGAAVQNFNVVYGFPETTALL
jgi:N-acetyl-gamma-glutamyl-phosphate reductase